MGRGIARFAGGTGCVERAKLEAGVSVSIGGSEPGGKEAAATIAGAAKALVEQASTEEDQAQLDMLEPLTAEETAEAQEALGANAGPLAVVRHAREQRRIGRPPGSRNRRTADFVQYLSKFGPDPAVAMAKIVGESEEAMIERSRMLDPPKKRMSYGEARAMRIRCAEGLLPYYHGKQPVQVDATIRGVLVREEIGELREARGRAIDGAFSVIPPGEWGGDDA